MATTRDRHRSEGQAPQRLERLMNELLVVAEDLAIANTRQDVARTIVECAGAPLEVRAIALWARTADGPYLELLDATPEEHEAEARYRQIPLDSDTPIATAISTGQRIFLESRADYAARFPASYARFDAMQLMDRNAFAIIPCTAGSMAVGALLFTYASERTFDDAEKMYQTLLARHCALAIARVDSLEQERAQREAAVLAARAEKQARADVELLYELIAAFNRLEDIDAVYRFALESAKRGSRSDRAAILLFDAANKMRFRAWSGLSDRYRAAVDGHSPWKADDSFPAPVVVADTETDPAWAAYRHVFADEGIRALAFVPIVHQRKLVGKFMLYRNEPRAFEPRDLQLTASVAVHVAQAVERKQHEREIARAYREERDAHAVAEEAACGREEILSVVSHDLRNPLGTIMVGAAMLMQPDACDRPQRVRVNAERIHRQAERMARLIENLVDFSGIQKGVVSLERRKHAPDAILSTARDIFGPIASERGLRLATEILGNLPHVECDSDRAVQVLSNLVANALKVTPKGGEIAIGASLLRPATVRAEGADGARSGELVFYVRDSGPGIDPDELPKLFDRTWRGKDSAYRGTGLGLSIARGIVDAHGGRIWAESRPGTGSTFYFSLGRA
jgi:signal transduction histidine kinase